MLVVLNDCLTDVFTPGEGDGAVVTTIGRKYATVNGAHGEWRGEAALLILGADSIGALAAYLPVPLPSPTIEPAAPVVTAHVPTTELAEGDTIHSYGMVLRLTARREYPADSEYQGPVIVFDGVVENYVEVNALADAGDDIARFIRDGVRSDMQRKGSDVAVWRVQGNRLATWLRVSS